MAIRLSRPQNQKSLAKLFGHVSQNGASKEKLPSVKRKDEVRLCTIERTARPDITACGMRNSASRHGRRSTMRGKINKGNSTTADSLDSSAPISERIETEYQRSRRFSRNRTQAINEIRPKRRSSGSVDPDSHMMASWWPSCTAKKPAAQVAREAPTVRHAPSE